ncbi:hydrogenase nickel incorporation protein HypA [Thermogladius sp. 4427co]|uniref:hydrogenase nickel incorporation protein HypA n=1 Tax=Thermogladius sp. 4427co TaxID=3450718 RepID=UPI003F793306
MVHEWSLAEAVVKYVASIYGNRIRTLRIKIGVLQNIDKDIFTFSLRELSSLYNVSVDELEIVDEEPVFRCNVCGYEWSLDPGSLTNDVRESIHFLPESVYAYFKCPRCGSRDFRIVKGRGVEVLEVRPY